MKHLAVCSRLRLCICLFLLCFALAPLFSMDLNVNYGADLSAKFAVSDWFSYEYKLSPWIDFRFADGWRFTVQGSAYYRLNPKVPHCRPFVDLELFRIQTRKFPFCHGFVNYEFGRIKIKDTHEMIMNESADGVAIHVNIPGIVMDVTATYIGFQSYYTSTSMLSYDDFYNASVLPEPYYGLAAKRAIFQWSTLFPEFGGNRIDLFGDMVAQLDLRRVINESKLTKKKKDIKELVDSVYMATGINGPFLKTTRLYYDLGIVGEAISRQTAKKSETYMAGYLNAGMSWFLMRNMQLATRLQYGTPNNDEGMSEYRPITYKNAGIFYEGGFADLVKPELSFKWKPSSQVSFTTSLSGFIRPRRKDELKNIKTRREKFEKIYTYTEFSVGGMFVIANDVRIGADIMYGVNSIKKNRMFDYSVQLKLNVGL